MTPDTPPPAVKTPPTGPQPQDAAPDRDEWITAAEAAALFGIKPEGFTKRVRTGGLPWRQEGGRRLYSRAAAVADQERRRRELSEHMAVLRRRREVKPSPPSEALIQPSAPAVPGRQSAPRRDKAELLRQTVQWGQAQTAALERALQAIGGLD